MKRKIMNKNMLMMIVQLTFILGVIVAILFVYPKMEVEFDEERVNFKSINANAIIISNSPDFSNSRYIEVEDSLSLDLEPGEYYWKSSNSFINGFSSSFVVDSEVGLEIEDDELKNTGNVKLNITESEGGFLVGHIILDPDESSEIENKNGSEYVGRQE